MSVEECQEKKITKGKQITKRKEKELFKTKWRETFQKNYRFRYLFF